MELVRIGDLSCAACAVALAGGGSGFKPQALHPLKPARLGALDPAAIDDALVTPVMESVLKEAGLGVNASNAGAVYQMLALFAVTRGLDASFPDPYRDVFTGVQEYGRDPARIADFKRLRESREQLRQAALFYNGAQLKRTIDAYNVNETAINIPGFGPSYNDQIEARRQELDGLVNQYHGLRNALSPEWVALPIALTDALDPGTRQAAIVFIGRAGGPPAVMKELEKLTPGRKSGWPLIAMVAAAAGGAALLMR